MKKEAINTVIQTQTKSWEQLIHWYEQQVAPDPALAIGQDIPPIQTEKILKALLTNTLPRFLYDFFDQFQVKILPMEEESGKWGYMIKIPDQHDLVSGFFGYQSRVEAEEEAFLEAFELMEEVLNNANTGDR